MRRRALYSIGIVLVLLLAVGGTLLALLRHEPKWYRNALPSPGKLRAQRSHEFLKEFFALWNSAGNDEIWSATFTDEQINSYFEEGFKLSNAAARMLPEDISDPRVRFDANRLRLAFRSGRGAWETVVSVETKIWLPPREPNVASIELVGFHLGAIPISAQSLLERLADVGRANGIEVTWYRAPETGHPVAILRFQADKARPTMQIRVVKLEPGKITIHGKSMDPVALAQPAGPDRAALVRLAAAIQADR